MVYRQTDRSERVRAAARGKILRAARKLFAAKGFDATTIHEVVSAARTSTGNLYFYFPRKEDLLWGVVEESSAAMVGASEAAIAGAPPGPARLAVLVFTNVRQALTANREFAQIVMVGVSRQIVYDRIIEGFATRLREHMRANASSLPESDIELAVSSWGGAVLMLLERQILGRVGAPWLRIAQYVVRWNLRGLGVPEAEVEAALAWATQAVGDGETA